MAQRVLLSDEEYAVTEKAVKDFRLTSGPPLQEKLKAIDKVTLIFLMLKLFQTESYFLNIYMCVINIFFLMYYADDN